MEVGGHRRHIAEKLGDDDHERQPLAGALDVLLGRAASCEVAFEPDHQASDQDGGLTAVVAPRPFQQLRAIELAQQRQQIHFALRRAPILARDCTRS